MTASFYFHGNRHKDRKVCKGGFLRRGNLCGLLQKRQEWKQCLVFLCVCVCVGSLCDLAPQPSPPIASSRSRSLSCVSFCENFKRPCGAASLFFCVCVCVCVPLQQQSLWCHVNSKLQPLTFLGYAWTCSRLPLTLMNPAAIS